MTRYIFELIVVPIWLAILAFALWVLMGVRGCAAPQDAVVRLKSHGLSGVVIWTEPGRTLILSAAHGFEGKSRNQPVTVEAPVPVGFPAPQGLARAKVVSVDYHLDLALVEMTTGPLPYVCPVAPKGWHSGRMISAGYDKMTSRTVSETATSLGSDGPRQYTRENPIPGRSGGGLIDADSNVLLGCCTGYETGGSRRGIYSSLTSVWTFLDRYNGQTPLDRPPPGRPTVREFVEDRQGNVRPYCPPGHVCPPGGT